MNLKLLFVRRMYRKTIKRQIHVENLIFNLKQKLEEIKKDKDYWFKEYFTIHAEITNKKVDEVNKYG